MDLWVVAAVAGAGYAAKNLQNLSLEKKESSSDQSLRKPLNFQSEARNFLQQIRDKTCPLRRLDQKTAQIDYSDVNSHQIDQFSERDPHSIVSTSGNSGVEFFEFENFRSSNRSKFVKRKTRQLPSLKRLNHLENCFDAQASKEGEKSDENLCSLFPPVSTVGPVLVTNGTGIIRKSSSCSSFVHLEEENGVCSRESKLKNCSGVEKLSDLNNGVESGRSFHSSVPNGTLLFIIGMTIGIMSASIASKNELDELNKQLKQANNLVQDLQEELDMKEMITMKEIEPHASPSDPEPKNSNKIGSVKENDKNIENSELMKKIEAELQAELEMLEQNMKASSLERMSSVLEIDSNFDPDIIQGDIKQMKSDSTNESSDTTTNFFQTANYSVSPFELTLRLHELIESRLEERIKELETTLSNSQNRVQVLDSRTDLSGRRRLSCSETENSSPPQSPTCIDEQDLMLENNIFTNSCDEINYGFLLGDREKGDGEIGLVQDLPSFMSNVDFESEDESGDESEMLLIKKIVERRRSSSNFCSTLLD